MNTKELYNQYKNRLQKIADVKFASAVLHWDQETYLPPKGNAIRGRQLATLTELAHQHFTEDATGVLLQELMLKNDLDLKERKNVELSLYDYTKSKKLGSDFVRRMSETVNRSFHAWVQARKDNSFAGFEKPLDDLIQLKKQEAELLGYEKHPYDALMNEFDRGQTVSIVDEIFSALKPRLTNLLELIKKNPPTDDSFLHQSFDKDGQWKLGIEVIKRMHFDLDAGRQDISTHPFTINFNSHDVRITTRIDENDFSNMLWSCIHECGHALYEQGLPTEEYGLPLGEYSSLSVHESQSRLWENNVGRSFAFCQYNLPLFKKFFPQQLNNISPEQFYRGINKVQPSLIRTEADELTYHFHVMLRYEIEKLLIGGDMKTRDIPEYWNAHYKQYLGVEVPDDKNGCLQDVHWGHGSFGYFATYSLGSLYAAQLYAAFCRQNPSFEKTLALGDSTALLQWLRQQIHKHGRYYTAEEICRHATGEPLSSDYFIAYATKKYGELYSL